MHVVIISRWWILILYKYMAVFKYHSGNNCFKYHSGNNCFKYHNWYGFNRDGDKYRFNYQFFLYDNSIWILNSPGGDRTHNLQLRRLTRYPITLRDYSKRVTL